jgi:hypothetical protein
MPAAAYKTSGSEFNAMSGRSTPLGPRHHVGPIHLDDDPAVGAISLAVLRGVAERVLARELVGDFGVDTVEVVDLRREERPSASFLRELAHHELGLVNPLLCVSAPRSAIVKIATSLRLASSSTSSNEIRLDVSSPSENSTSAWRRTSSSPAGLHLRQFLQRDVNRVIERRRAARGRLLDGGLQLGLVRRERLTNLDAAVEVDDLRHVVRLEAVHEVGRGVCNVGSLSSMLALLSSSSDIAIGCCLRVKNDRSCLTPSSNTEKSFSSRSVT